MEIGDEALWPAVCLWGFRVIIKAHFPLPISALPCSERMNPQYHRELNALVLYVSLHDSANAHTHPLTTPTPSSVTVNWGRSWMRRGVAAFCWHGKVASTNAAASAAARSSHSCWTPSARAATAITTSARPAGCTASGTAPGCAQPARRAGKDGESVASLCADHKWQLWVCHCDQSLSVVPSVLAADKMSVCYQLFTARYYSHTEVVCRTVIVNYWGSKWGINIVTPDQLLQTLWLDWWMPGVMDAFQYEEPYWRFSHLMVG